MFRLLDGTDAYVQAFIDNDSRRIFAGRIGGKREPAETAALLVKAEKASCREALKLNQATTLMVDGGVENFNEAVDRLVHGGALMRIVAQTDIRFSDSSIERFWRCCSVFAMSGCLMSSPESFGSHQEPMGTRERPRDPVDGCRA